MIHRNSVCRKVVILLKTSTIHESCRSYVPGWGNPENVLRKVLEFPLWQNNCIATRLFHFRIYIQNAVPSPPTMHPDHSNLSDPSFVAIPPPKENEIGNRAGVVDTPRSSHVPVKKLRIGRETMSRKKYKERVLEFVFADALV